MQDVTALSLMRFASGVLYYADHAANGVKASQYITDIHNKQDLDKFIDQQDSKILTVIDVCLRNAGPCIHIFPAVLALAKNFTGYAHFARLIGDESDATQQVLQELNVNEVSLHMTSSDMMCFKYTLASVCCMGKINDLCSMSGLAGICQATATDVLAIDAMQVPTFLFYRGGKTTGRHVGSSRADLIGQILQQQNAHGVRPPVTGQGTQSSRRKIERRV